MRLSLARKAFTLVELLIVMAILGVLIALSVPGLLRARVNSNEGGARHHLQMYVSALESFRAAQPIPQYPAGLGVLAAANPPYLDPLLAAGSRQGYNFAYVRISPTQFTLTATPTVANVTGENTYFVDESGVIRFDNAAGDPAE